MRSVKDSNQCHVHKWIALPTELTDLPDVRVGFEPTMSNLTTSRVQIALGPWCLGDSAPCLITLLTNNDSSAFYFQHREPVYSLAHLTAVWELKFIVFFL